MAIRPSRWLNRKSRDRAARNWASMAERVEEMPLGRIRRLSDEALGLRASLNRFLMRGEHQVSLSRASLDALQLPGGTDWRWRPGFMGGRVSPRGISAPQPGARLGKRATVWHDCEDPAIILEQITNPRATDLSPYGLRLEVFSFEGSFLSLAIDLPTEAMVGLTRNHVLRVETALMAERPVNIYARLNIGHGPNVEEVIEKLHGVDAGLQSQQVIEFDLAYTEMNEKRLEKIWLDLIFEQPQMCAVEIRELFLSRHLRADY